MAAVNVSEMRTAEAAALAAGWSEEALLDHAGERLGQAVGRFFPHPGTVIGYLGKGHNAGDTLVALRVLRDDFGWKIATRQAFPLDDCARLMIRKWQQLGLSASLDHAPSALDLPAPLVLLDGLLGTGSRGALSAPLLALTAEMAWLRHEAGAQIAAVDQPTGMDADTGVSAPGGVTADITFMIGNAKRGLLTGQAAHATGALALVAVDPLTTDCGGALASTVIDRRYRLDPVDPLTAAEIELIAPQSLGFAKARRPYDFHKGMAGRVAILAGSARFPGAAVLAAIGALRGGAGLITLHVPARIAQRIAAQCPPEIILRTYHSPLEWHHLHGDALVIGCGLGDMDDASAACLLEGIAHASGPVVIDADALNLIARSGQLGMIGPSHLLTPHPGEFQRLAPDLAGLPREIAARRFTDRCPATLLLKGCRTLVTRRDHPLWANATGHPGMATGGQGDLLAGLIGARLAAGDPPTEAASLAAWLCGRSAEIALNATGLSQESLTPSDVARYLGSAFLDWQRARR